MLAQDVINELKKHKDPIRAEHSKRFFKTGKGEYAEGDIFWGLTVPQTRQVSRKYKQLSLKEILPLLKSPIHEHRQVALMILVHQFAKGDEKVQKEIYDIYLSHTKYINNWDLVDGSAEKIIGPYLEDKPRHVLYKLVQSDSIWERRIAIMSTFHYIKLGQFDDALKISELLLKDTHDLIHKAVGWMLREIGKRDQKVEEAFLKKHYQTMPRTMLRYAIERFPEPLRKKYLLGTI